MSILTRARQLQSIAQLDTPEGRVAAERLGRLLEQNPDIELDKQQDVVYEIPPLLGGTTEDKLLILALSSGFKCKVFRGRDKWHVSGVKWRVEEVESLYFKSSRLINSSLRLGQSSDWTESHIQGFRHGLQSRLGSPDEYLFEGQSLNSSTNIYVRESSNFAGTSGYKRGRRKALLVELKEKR